MLATVLVDAALLVLGVFAHPREDTAGAVPDAPVKSGIDADDIWRYHSIVLKQKEKIIL